jgi:hypothetical protein
MNGEDQMPRTIILDTDVLIDARRGVEEAINYLNIHTINGHPKNILDFSSFYLFNTFIEY